MANPPTRRKKASPSNSSACSQRTRLPEPDEAAARARGTEGNATGDRKKRKRQDDIVNDFYLSLVRAELSKEVRADLLCKKKHILMTQSNGGADVLVAQKAKDPRGQEVDNGSIPLDDTNHEGVLHMKKIDERSRTTKKGWDCFQNIMEEDLPSIADKRSSYQDADILTKTASLSTSFSGPDPAGNAATTSTGFVPPGVAATSYPGPDPPGVAATSYPWPDPLDTTAASYPALDPPGEVATSYSVPEPPDNAATSSLGPSSPGNAASAADPPGVVAASSSATQPPGVVTASSTAPQLSGNVAASFLATQPSDNVAASSSVPQPPGVVAASSTRDDDNALMLLPLMVFGIFVFVIVSLSIFLFACLCAGQCVVLCVTLGALAKGITTPIQNAGRGDSGLPAPKGRVSTTLQYKAPTSLSKGIPAGALFTPGPSCNMNDSAICWGALQSGNKCAKLECNHIFHERCILQALLHKPECPVCRKSIGEPVGKCPSGTMTTTITPDRCSGFQEDSIVITYEIPAGKQMSYHCNPGITHASKCTDAFIPK